MKTRVILALLLPEDVFMDNHDLSEVIVQATLDVIEKVLLFEATAGTTIDLFDMFK